MKNCILVRHPHLVIISCYPLQHVIWSLPLQKKFVIVSWQNDKYLALFSVVSCCDHKAASASSVHSDTPDAPMRMYLQAAGEDPTRIYKSSLCPAVPRHLSRFPTWASMVLSLSFHIVAHGVKIWYLFEALPYRRMAVLEYTWHSLLVFPDKAFIRSVSSCRSTSPQSHYTAGDMESSLFAWQKPND